MRIFASANVSSIAGLTLSLFAFGGCGGESPTSGAPLPAATQGSGTSTTGAATTSGGASCAAGQTLCSGVCTDVNTDLANCGGCGVPCAQGQTCSAGQCTCVAGLSACSAGCTDTNADAANCGGCGVACAADEVCSLGACGSSCSAGLMQCGQDCVDTTTSSLHCGGCNNACPAGRECVSGMCSCTAGLNLCNGECLDFASDPQNCGSCGYVCASNVCAAGACGDTSLGTGGATSTASTSGASSTDSGSTDGASTDGASTDGGSTDGGSTDGGSTTGAGGASSTGGTTTGGDGGNGGAPTTTGDETTTTTSTTGSGGTGTCSGPENPPAEFQQTIDITWTEMTGGFQGQTGARPASGGVQNFTNAILDQLFAADGTLRFCVRWESNATVSATMRDQIEQALQRGVNEWFEKLNGYDCFPYGEIPVQVTGWATADRNLLLWDDDSVRVDVGDFREGAPQCQENCGRFFHQQSGYTYPNCPGGFDAHYDMSLWLTAGMGGGAGGDWGQRVGSEYFTDSVTSEHQHIWIHEFGHGLGFPDYYNWDVWAPGVELPNSVMVAGRATLVTEWDTWMIRRLWTELKGRWQ